MNKLNFKIIDKQRPSNDEENRLQRARERFVENASIQLKMAEAFASNKQMPEFEEEITKDGMTVTISKAPKPWWFHDLDGVFYLCPRYSNRALFGKDRAIQVGDIKQLSKTITDMINAVTAGDFDEQLTACSRRHK
jgi:hypothetical protein